MTAEFRNLLNSQPRNARAGLTLLTVMLKAERGRIVSATVLVFLLSGLAMLGPVITRQVIDYIDGGRGDLLTGAGLFGLFILVSFTINILQASSGYQFELVANYLSGSICMMLFEKALRRPSLDSKRYSSGNVTTMATVDLERLGLLSYYLSSTMFVPLQLGLGVLLMYDAVGAAFTAGLATILALNLLNYKVSSWIAVFNEDLMKARDARTKQVTEMVNSIALVKLCALEQFCGARIEARRREELVCLRNENLSYVLAIFLNWSSAGLILSATFTMFYWLGHTITAAQAFEVIIVFSILGEAVRQLPDSINSLIQTWVSLKRIESFLLSPEIDNPHITHHRAAAS
jgi:ABC-type multidrug transport system fused ATPase/permease subunit